MNVELTDDLIERAIATVGVRGRVVVEQRATPRTPWMAMTAPRYWGAYYEGDTFEQEGYHRLAVREGMHGPVMLMVLLHELVHAHQFERGDGPRLVGMDSPLYKDGTGYQWELTVAEYEAWFRSTALANAWLGLDWSIGQWHDAMFEVQEGRPPRGRESAVAEGWTLDPSEIIKVDPERS